MLSMGTGKDQTIEGIDLLGEVYYPISGFDDLVNLVNRFLCYDRRCHPAGSEMITAHRIAPREYPCLGRFWERSGDYGDWAGHEYLYEDELRETLTNLQRLF